MSPTHPSSVTVLSAPLPLPGSADGWSQTSQPCLTSMVRSRQEAIMRLEQGAQVGTVATFKGKTHGKGVREHLRETGGARARDQQLCPCHCTAVGTVTTLCHTCSLQVSLLSPWAVGSVALYASYTLPNHREKVPF